MPPKRKPAAELDDDGSSSSSSDVGMELSEEEETDDEEEAKEPDWSNHPARAFLKEEFMAGRISLNYSKTGGPKKVYNKCENHPSFEGMPYDRTFTQRLRSLRIICGKKIQRVQDDAEACELFMKHHPRPTTDHHGGPRWDGSEAQYWLKKDLKQEDNRNMKSSLLRDTRTAYKKFTPKKFAGHVNQEKRLRKLALWLDKRGKTAQNFNSSSSSSSSSSDD